MRAYLGCEGEIHLYDVRREISVGVLYGHAEW